VNINLTLVVQMLVFLALIWFTMKFVWPMILGQMDERAKKIALGLAAAEKGQAELAQAHTQAEALLHEARERGQKIVDQAQHRANEIMEQARIAATAEGARLVRSAEQQIVMESNSAREQLRKDVGRIAVGAASKLLEREIDPRAHAALLDELAAQL
jgi:F-type H+-transporting ATPase subunit b